jgi:SecD/SecF fusion protein
MADPKSQQIDPIKKQIVLIGVLIAFAAILLFVVPLLFSRPPFRLGLDLQGGTRYAFKLAPDTEQLGPGENQQSVVLDTISIIRSRIDPQGTLEPVLRLEGTDRLVVELPGLDELEGQKAASTLRAPLGETSGPGEPIGLQPSASMEFPADGGTVRIGEELISYSAFTGSDLVVRERGAKGTVKATHAEGATVELVSTNAIQNRIENLGKLSFEIVLQGGDRSDSLMQDLGTSYQAEKAKLDAWFENNKGAVDLDAFNALAATAGGPNPGIRWVPERRYRDQKTGAINDGRSLSERARPLLIARLHPRYGDRDWNMTGARLASTFPTNDELGRPAVGFEVLAEYAPAFQAFTKEFRGENMAIVLNEEIQSAPELNDPIYDRGIITGQFTFKEVEDLVGVLRSGSLRLKPVLEYEEKVGPSLGGENVVRAWISGLVSFVVTVGFMIAYYRRLGVYAALSLCINLFLLMGGLALANATLTLPGIAGLILTIGMAVDGNILIFDRIREERDEGRNIKQASRTGFEKALSTIVDANLTTLITGLILFFVGTGPVRGFAVTLCIGILTSMFAALVVTRVMVVLSLERKAEDFSMGRWMVEANYDWMSKKKLCAVLSIGAILIGLVFVRMVPKKTLLGIDFLGGADLQLRTELPIETDALRQRVAQLQGDLAKAEVKPILSSSAGDGKYTDFRLTFKLDDATLAEGDVGGVFKDQVSKEFDDLLQRGPIDLQPIEGGGSNLRLYFEQQHPAEDVQARLVAAPGGLFANAMVSSDPSRRGAYTVTGADLGDWVAVQGAVQETFRDMRDTAGKAFKLSNPIPNSSTVGAQVVGEMRDKAILAILASLFAVVLYIRARFAEYSYGFAAVVALVHDILFTLGMIGIVDYFGILNLEINLAVVAAFLTIVGYSLNDTIVVFDRVRENRARFGKPLAELLNLSINQTLSRTILTSGTTLLTTLILFLANVGTGNALETFAFAILMGVGVGTYSSIYIASPLLEWYERVAAKYASKSPVMAAPAPAPEEANV